MTSLRRYVFVEGAGEVEAMGNLVSRMSLRIGDAVPWAKPLRWKNLHQFIGGQGGVHAALNFARTRTNIASLLLVRDADEGCPVQLVPHIADKIREAAPAFPVAYVLLKPEYEVLFLPCIERMAGRDLEGRTGLKPGVKWDAPTWEFRRGVKEWLSKNFSKGKAYKPSIDQLALTRLIDLETLSQASVPCFGTLERALQFLAREKSGVYPQKSKKRT